MNLELKLKEVIRDIKDFPEEGIVFKDITPLLIRTELVRKILEDVKEYFHLEDIDIVAGIESRGFILGMVLAYELDKPFVPIRKKGKLPYRTVSHEYLLEYGSSAVEMHVDAIDKGQRVLIHDDLLATGGTAAAAAELVLKLGGEISGFSFIIELEYLNGSNVLNKYHQNIHSIISYGESD